MKFPPTCNGSEPGIAKPSLGVAALATCCQYQASMTNSRAQHVAFFFREGFLSGVPCWKNDRFENLISSAGPLLGDFLAPRLLGGVNREVCESSRLVQIAVLYLHAAKSDLSVEIGF